MRRKLTMNWQKGVNNCNFRYVCRQVLECFGLYARTSLTTIYDTYIYVRTTGFVCFSSAYVCTYIGTVYCTKLYVYIYLLLPKDMLLVFRSVQGKWRVVTYM